MTVSNLRLADGRTVSVEQDLIETAYRVPVQSWRHTDSQGHEHRWQDDALPSLRWIEDYPGDDEYPPEGHYECITCGERVPSPPMGYPPYKQYLRGPTTYYIDGQPVTEEEARAALEQVREAGAS